MPLQICLHGSFLSTMNASRSEYRFPPTDGPNRRVVLATTHRY
jgi:hypothetical protein